MYAVKVSITFKNGLTFKSISFLLVLSSSPHWFLCLHICPGFIFLKNEIPIFLKLTVLLLWLMFAEACFRRPFHSYCRTVLLHVFTLSLAYLIMGVGVLSTLLYWEIYCYAHFHTIYFLIYGVHMRFHGWVIILYA